MAEDWQAAGFGIYVHWPFCQSKCPYCDFNSHVAASIDQRAWAKAYVSELTRYRDMFPERIVNSVFFGGGTPSLMDPRIVETITTCIAESWTFARDVEITLEANPSSVEAGRFAAYRDAGVNRVSLGIQSLEDIDLKRLGRLHSASEGLRAIEIAQGAFPRVSFDLIYARQDQSLDQWQAELSRALALGTEHLSLYQLTIEDGTAFGRLHSVGKLPGLPGDDLSADMYAATQAICGSHGLPAYEVSNHAAEFAQSRHNLIYWRGGDYIGIGPGAHGRLTLGGTRFATETALDPATWLDAAAKGNGESRRQAVEPRERAFEYLMMALRLTEGVDIPRLLDMDNALLNNDKVADLIAGGYLRQSNRALGATDAGRMVLNAIIRDITNG
ncbi:MAG: radical SAM family heme chaperone HemW [Rhodobacteraceae bacterium]|nr:radical SAM family heme chaperone HemW [Paracoccaceae bacterium]